MRTVLLFLALFGALFLAYRSGKPIHAQDPPRATNTGAPDLITVAGVEYVDYSSEVEGGEVGEYGTYTDRNVLYANFPDGVNLGTFAPDGTLKYPYPACTASSFVRHSDGVHVVTAYPRSNRVLIQVAPAFQRHEPDYVSWVCVGANSDVINP